MLLAAVFFGLFFSVCIAALVWPRPRARRRGPRRVGRPRVSILVAARNEEATIERCLRSLADQHYPASRLEILIADDGSTDNTAAVVRAFIEGKPQFRLLAVPGGVGAVQGKTNALAYLCRVATADYFLFTDADMALAPDWVSAMLAAATPGVGVVTGITTAGGNLFGRLQGLDWLFGLNLISMLADHGLPTTALGNNMLLTRTAYHDVGGYENMAFSTHEDLQLFRRIVARGWGFRNLCSPAVLGVSAPQPTVAALLQQRKRWMKGTTDLPWYFSGLFGLYAAFYSVLFWPGLLPLAPLALLYGGKIFLQTLFLHSALRRVGRRERLGVLLLYEPYLCLMSVLVLAYVLWPGPVEWKQRRYAWAEA
ncbi:glycosyltransferase [Hymenobacter sp. BT770]|uniref:glycosyltransferase n=1 Tax=Hymenobacter sp. BT770 TaxID=2886942 RepID=UPI001D10B497|nr:glycosyltransferase [Hymenobacter sp. BT770]MCC3154138.1 glycosyltransferase [Hymenobacter sp. BT770]MDO3414415.1 glycosyltransferase [Hymenobacter sp. BT770]